MRWFIAASVASLAVVLFGGVGTWAEDDKKPKQKPAGKAARPGPVTLTDPGPTPPANEFQRFAEFATMESFNNSYYGEIYFDRVARWRAGKLRSLKLADPALRKAAQDYAVIARKSWFAVQLKDTTNWSPEAIQKTIDAALESEDALEKDIKQNLRLTLTKVRALDEARKLAWESRLDHARLWDRVLAAVKPVGGPEWEKFPLRFGVWGRSNWDPFWVRNVSGKPLTNLTIVVRTNASAQLPADAALHVVSFERLEPNEWVCLPERLVNKLWDQRARVYQPGSNVFRCSVWSSEVHFEDVGFDVKALPARAHDFAAAPNGWCKFGCFPTSDFRGHYDVTLPWPPVGVRTARQKFLAQSPWAGTDAKANKDYSVEIEDVVGANLTHVRLSITEDRVIEGKVTKYSQSAVFEGKLWGNRFELEQAYSSTVDRPGFPTRIWGTIRGEEMELNYGKGKTADGKVMLRDLRNHAVAAAAAAFTVGSVWGDDDTKMTFTVLEREDDRFRARYQIGDTIDREINGVVNGNSVYWHAKDVRATRGGAGGDNSGFFLAHKDGPRIEFSWRNSKGASGSFILRLRAEKEAPR